MKELQSIIKDYIKKNEMIQNENGAIEKAYG